MKLASKVFLKFSSSNLLIDNYDPFVVHFENIYAFLAYDEGHKGHDLKADSTLQMWPLRMCKWTNLITRSAAVLRGTMQNGQHKTWQAGGSYVTVDIQNWYSSTHIKKHKG